MASNAAWTPASKMGIIPLRPLTFGEILGRSFSALRHNPRVLLGFAVGVAAVVSLITTMILTFMTIAMIQRVASFPASERGSDEFRQVMIGSAALLAVVAFVLGLVALMISTIVQAVVAAEVGGAVVAERQTLREIMRRVRSSIWRILGYSLLVSAAVVVLIVAFFLLVFPFGRLGALLAVFAMLATIPLTIWIGTKLVLTPSVIVLEESGVFASIRRSWRLTKGFFWKTLGIWVLIGLIFGVAGQATGTVFGFLTERLVPVLAPTGDKNLDMLGQLIGMSLIPAAVTTVISAIGAVVSSTGTAILYVDIRMRTEGLDIDLQRYVENRDAGRSVPANPYLYDPAHRPAPRDFGYGAPPFLYGSAQPASFDQFAPGAPFGEAGQPPFAGNQGAAADSLPKDVSGVPDGTLNPPPYAPPVAPGYQAPRPFFPVDEPDDGRNPTA